MSSFGGFGSSGNSGTKFAFGRDRDGDGDGSRKAFTFDAAPASRSAFPFGGSSSTGPALAVPQHSEGAVFKSTPTPRAAHPMFDEFDSTVPKSPFGTVTSSARQSCGPAFSAVKAASTRASSSSPLVTTSAQVSSLPMFSAHMPKPTATTTTTKISDTATGAVSRVLPSAPDSLVAGPFAPSSMTTAAAAPVMVMTHGTSPPFTFCPSPLSTNAAAPPASWPMPHSTDRGSPDDRADKKAAVTRTSRAASEVLSREEERVPDDIWVCEVCHKTKDLGGPHLAGKSTVRSDCWPCGVKQVFRRSPSSAINPARVQPNETKAGDAAPNGRQRAPHVPANGADGFFVPAETDAATAASASTWFDQELLRAYRHRLVAGIPLRCVWRNHVLYVMTPDTPYAISDVAAHAFRFPKAGEAGPLALPAACGANDAQAVAQINMGRFAAMFLAIDHKVASSKFNRVGRLFCFNDFSYAAACIYARRFACPPENVRAAQGTSAPDYVGQLEVHGPKKDPTASRTVWNSIVDDCPLSFSSVVSLEQRIEASKRVYQRTSWMVLPENTTAAALLDAVENDAVDTDTVMCPSTADVVLLPETMKLEDLSKFPALINS